MTTVIVAAVRIHAMVVVGVAILGVVPRALRGLVSLCHQSSLSAGCNCRREHPDAAVLRAPRAAHRTGMLHRRAPALPAGHGRAVGTSELKPRARQNVVFEMGYFFGKLDPHHVVVINEGVERPSDIDGIVYLFTDSPDWQRSLARELEAAGIAGNWLR
jgi:hypothetical protein